MEIVTPFQERLITEDRMVVTFANINEQEILSYLAGELHGSAIRNDLHEYECDNFYTTRNSQQIHDILDTFQGFCKAKEAEIIIWKPHLEHQKFDSVRIHG